MGFVAAPQQRRFALDCSVSLCHQQRRQTIPTHHPGRGARSPGPVARAQVPQAPGRGAAVVEGGRPRLWAQAHACHVGRWPRWRPALGRPPAPPQQLHAVVQSMRGQSPQSGCGSQGLPRNPDQKRHPQPSTTTAETVGQGRRPSLVPRPISSGAARAWRGSRCSSPSPRGTCRRRTAAGTSRGGGHTPMHRSAASCSVAGTPWMCPFASTPVPLFWAGASHSPVTLWRIHVWGTEFDSIHFRWAGGLTGGAPLPGRRRR